MKVIMFLLAGLLVVNVSTAQNQLVTKEAYANFFSHTSIEDIKSNNYKVKSSLSLTDGKIEFSIPMEGFEFEKPLIQEQFNSSDFLNTEMFPEAVFHGGIIKMDDLDFSKDGVTSIILEGNLTICGKTKHVKEEGKLAIKGEKITITSIFRLGLENYGINFKKRNSASNFAQTVDLSVALAYQSL